MRAPLRSALLALPLALLTGVACAPQAGAPLSWTAASQDPAVLNLVPATFAEGSGVTAEVLAECALDRKIPEAVARHTPVPVVLAEQPGARSLTLTVTQILAPGGGPWSGPKWINLHGELIEAGAVVASFDARRTTTRGMGTCEMLDIITDVLAQDVRPWLAQPNLNARLGEL